MTDMRKLIFVLDDDASMLGSLKRLLKLHGFDVEAFSTVDSFLKSANLSRAHCLVLDIQLNGRCGIELRRKLALSGILLPVIFITGNDRETTRKAALDAGCVAYLPKPFSAESLVEAVQNASTNSSAAFHSSI
jgi:FixJ family two-component response regulator